MRIGTTLTVVGFACGVLLAGCSASAHGNGNLGQLPRSSPAASAPPSTSPTTGTPTTTPSTARPKPPTSQPTVLPTPVHGPAGLPCTTKDVTVTADDEQGAAGTSVTTFTVVNKGNTPCEMDKWPFVAPYGPLKQGSSTVEADLNVAVHNLTPADSPTLGAVGGLIGLSPGDSAVFYLMWSHIPSSSDPNAKCPQADGFDFRPPQDPSTDDNLLVAYSFTPCGSRIEVSQIQLAS